MNLLNLAASLTLDKSNYDKGLNDAEKSAKNSQSSIGGALGGAMSVVGKGLKVAGTMAVTAAAAAGTATVKFVKDSVGAYAEYQQLWGGMQKLYGAAGQSFEEYVQSAGYSMDELVADGEANVGIIQDLQQEYDRLKSAESLIAENAKNAFQTAGMSANEYMNNISGISASLINNLGGDTKAAAEMADMAMRDIADNVNTFGKFTIQDITSVYQALARGNFQTLDNLQLGVAGTKGGMEELIKKAEAMDSTFKANRDTTGKLTMDYADMVQAIHIVQQNMNITGTTAREAEKTISGSLNMLKGAWANLVAGISNPDADIGKLIGDVLDSAKKALSNLLPTIKQAASGLVQLVRDVAPMITQELPDLVKELLPVVIDTASELFEGIIDAFPAFIEILVDELPSLLNMLLEATMELLPTLVQAALTLLNGVIEGLVAALPTIIQGLMGFVQSIAEWFRSEENIQTFVNNINELLRTVFGMLTGALPELIPALMDILLGIIDIVTSPDFIWQIFDLAMNLMVALAEGLMEALPKLLIKLPEIIINIVTAFIGLLPKIWEVGVEMMLTIKNGLFEALPKLLLAVPELIMHFIGAIVKLGGRLLDVGAQMIGFIKDGITKTAKNAKKWGKDLIANFIQGIKDKFNALKESVKGVASKIRDFLGFSEPKEGPLSNFHTYAPDMIDLFIKGIKSNQSRLNDAITNAFDFKPMITGGMNIEGLADPRSKYVSRTDELGGVTINVYGSKGQNVTELADIIGRKLNKDIRRNQEVWA